MARNIYNAIANFYKSLYKDTDTIISENDDFFQLCRMLIEGLFSGNVDVSYLDSIQYEVCSETKWIIYFIVKMI